MRLAQINLPKLSNTGASLVWTHENLQALLVRAFGGFTMTEGLGAWRDEATAKVYKEEVCVYSVAMEDTDENKREFKAIAAMIAADASQVCVFVVYASGDVDFVYPA